MSPSNFAPVSPIDITVDSQRRSNHTGRFANDPDLDEKSDIKATTRSLRTNSTASSRSSLRGGDKRVRRARFAEATSVFSPASGPGESQSPFADPPATGNMENGFSSSKPSDVGFGYIADNQPVEQTVYIRADPNGAAGQPLKSALKTPGTASRMLNPLSPTFREEQLLEKEELKTEIQQAKDLKVKTRVRMAKMVLRGVNFSCSLIVLAMLSTALTIFHATKTLPARNNLPPWASGQKTWPQIVVLSISCISLLFSIIVILAYCRGGHKRAEKVAVYYTMFAVGWFMFSTVMWLVAAGILHGSKASGNGQDLWGWSCKENKRRQLFQDDIHYALVCRLQDWSLICCIIEVVVELIVIAIYGIVFYRFWSKNRLRKSMDARDRARTDLYLAQLRTQSAPNTPGFAQTPRTPGFPSALKSLAPRDMYSAAEQGVAVSPTQFTTSPPSNTTASPFKLQAPPIRVTKATPVSTATEGIPSPRLFSSSSPPPQPPMSPPPEERIHQHMAAAPGEQQYEAVPIPGANYVPPSYNNHGHPGQAY
ncbi:uncharacterized protein Z520_06699 [Fonsecaea multimorphosa CBS 102226]|uniref:MARVEL domain-containing protein n=1 Tax=Fonsecaea multimorphosa CBS 102226 TaxID=1442371 RepID=A0A0D2ILR0_9EURO|nr:uncharacterized protein Z520_06699 [Fonsecaea multimorphosa CBS 102226]KIX97921.1 hypothetical protein Z520_06699 [Fonsecaea multimorphosa CBS 102226]OAL23690.1 hypothetical protein AYO22_06267 [Fonsecaea multimorphosa]